MNFEKLADPRGLARKASDPDQVRHLLAIAAIYDEMNREAVGTHQSVRASPTTSIIRAPICSALSGRRAALAQPC